MSARLLKAALLLAASGLPVFPIIARGKEPAIKGGFHAATTNPEAIRRLWRLGDRNIGVPCGAISGFWILDIDPGGEDHLHRLGAHHGPLPGTRAVRTGRGGSHLWFKYLGPIQCSAGRVAPHIDVRGDGGYAVAPPSIHENGQVYTWLSHSAAALAIPPKWLVELTRKRPSISERAMAGIRRPFSSPNAYGAAALKSEIVALAGAAPGTRNHRLNTCAFRLYQLVGGGELDGDLVRHRLIDSCVRNRLVADDGLPSVLATIRSGMRAGLKFPRSRKGAA
jgi:hypothetical protein